MRTVGGRIESSLKPARKTVKGFATAMGVPIATVKKWIANEEYPSQDMFELMAVVLALPPEDRWLEIGTHTHA